MVNLEYKGEALESGDDSRRNTGKDVQGILTAGQAENIKELMNAKDVATKKNIICVLKSLNLFDAFAAHYPKSCKKYKSLPSLDQNAAGYDEIVEAIRDAMVDSYVMVYPKNHWSGKGE